MRKFNRSHYRKIISYILTVLAVGFLLLMIRWLGVDSPETVYRIIRYNISGIDDNEIFPSRPLQASQSPFQFMESAGDSGVPQFITVEDKGDFSLDALLQANDTTAFLIIKDDTILFERYYNSGAQSSPSLSFSMAKSFLSILIGCALDDGYIRSVDQPVTDFVPELAANGFDRVTIKNLLQMTSGMDYVESDNPFGIHPRFYYTTHLEDEILKLRLKEEPGQEFIYKTGDNALLGLVLTRALGTKMITDYTQERLWGPLGMEYDGEWSIDQEGDGLEKTWCCLAATARDFAKLGRLYLNFGNWNGKQIVSRSWVEQSTKIDTSEGSAWNYQYQWWLASQDSGDFYAQGHLGQWMYVNPGKRLIIVRLGKRMGRLDSQEWIAILTYLVSHVR